MHMPSNRDLTSDEMDTLRRSRNPVVITGNGEVQTNEEASELHLGKFPDSMEFQSWNVNFKTEVCSKTADPQITMHWIYEVQMAKSIGKLLTSRSIVGRNDFAHDDILDATIASALKRLPDKHVHFRKRVGVGEQRAQKYDRFLRGRQVAYMIYEHFRKMITPPACYSLPVARNS